MKKVYTFLFVCFIAIQFIRPAKNNNSVIASHMISEVAPLPDNVNIIFKKACYDCHSNNTNYPWYSYVQPVNFWLTSHINDGKKHFNFDEFATYNLRKQYHKLEEVVEMVKEEHMPLSSYTFIHKDANLTSDERVMITSWAQSAMDSMKAHHPIDSLIKKKS